MTFATRAAAAAFFLMGTTAICAAQSSSFDDMVGHKLTAIDGSSISLNAASGGFAREIVSPSGAIERTYFAFINDKLGTVADASDIRKVTGVFRRAGSGIQIDYADGSTETLALNPGGGLTLQATSSGSTSCTSWYPEGHMFSLDERKAALAAFAVKLGLSDAAGSAPKSNCGAPVPAMDAKPVTTPAAIPEAPKPITGTVQPAQETSIAAAVVPATTGVGALPTVGKLLEPIAPATTAKLAAKAAAPETQSVEVRNSEIHLIDPVPGNDAKPQVLASATPPTSIAPDQHGASACLSVESDGSHWGFRNHCGYTVQFAYCLMGSNQLVSCRDGAVAGSVAGNGFGALVADESLKETDAKHDFRWVACQGGAGEVIPHLDQLDPPSGRCVR